MKEDREYVEITYLTKKRKKKIICRSDSMSKLILNHPSSVDQEEEEWCG